MNKLPYSSASSGEKALDEIKKILRGFGCAKFASGDDFETGEVFVQFVHREQQVQIRVGAKGYAAAWLKENPWTSRKQKTKSQWDNDALEIGSIAIYSVIRDWIKSTVTMIEIDAMKFETAFLAHVMLPNGRLVIEEIQAKKMLPNLAEIEE